MTDANGDTQSRETDVTASADDRAEPDGVRTAARRLAEVPGTLLWVTADGDRRELAGADAPATSDPVAGAIDGGGGHSRCRCGTSAWAAVVVREHVECGHVAVDGFVRGDGLFACPKCGTETEAIGRFPAVGTVTGCLACGDLLGHRSEASA
ncbi:hypothetical protein [Halorubrum sodomense]|uniref:Thaumarchaeal output domain-containing protein n=1 Tax=Halorubrum sodomense TaxID=35743 RepID=A0A1I6H417_HALSD|nr:hypothetical protein [Halorubrum sodomense]SFR49061.1 hypothetical protein SAMN04487937_2409 [Halorubrum sodomense]